MGLFRRSIGAITSYYGKVKTYFRSLLDTPWSGVSGIADPPAENKALALAPLYACVRILMEQISSLKLEAYKRDGETEPVVLKGQVAQFAASPAMYDSYVTWTRKLVASLALRGNAYGLIMKTNDDGTPQKIEWLHPDRVSVQDQNNDGITPFYFLDGVPIKRNKIKHIQLFPRPGRLVSVSPIGNFAELIGHSLSAYRYGGSWFEHGGTPPATFRNTGLKISNADAEVMSRRLENALLTRRPIVFGNDWEFEALKVTPEESQFIETIRMNATTIASIYGIPPEMVGGETGGSLTYNTKAGDGEALYKLVIRPWLEMIESALNQIFLSVGVRFNFTDLVRSDQNTRFLAWQIAVSGGFMTPNEVRRRENLPAIEGGDSLKEGSNVNGNQVNAGTGEGSGEPNSRRLCRCLQFRVKESWWFR